MFRATNRDFLAAAALLLLLAAAPFSHAQVKPALTRDISTAQPVSGFCTMSEFDTPGYAKCNLYTVPAGKRLVVEMVSYRVARDPAYKVMQLLFGRADAFSSNFLFGPKVLQVTPAEVFDPSLRMYAGSQSVRLYLEENDLFGAIAYFQTGGPAYEQQFGFVGYLVDK